MFFSFKINVFLNRLINIEPSSIVGYRPQSLVLGQDKGVVATDQQLAAELKQQVTPATDPATRNKTSLAKGYTCCSATFSVTGTATGRESGSTIVNTVCVVKVQVHRYVVSPVVQQPAQQAPQLAFAIAQLVR